MIIKLNTGENNWAYFESNEIYIDKMLYQNLYSNDVIWILQDGTELMENKEIKYIRLVYETGIKSIATNRIGFFLNNEGKTIDRI